MDTPKNLNSIDIHKLNKNVDMLRHILEQCEVFVLTVKEKANMLMNSQITPRGDDDTEAQDLIAARSALLKTLLEELANPKNNILRGHIAQREQVIQDAINNPNNIEVLNDFLHKGTGNMFITIQNHYLGLTVDLAVFLDMLHKTRVEYTLDMTELGQAVGKWVSKNEQEVVLH
jgi:accessory colonization factor AcfC